MNEYEDLSRGILISMAKSRYNPSLANRLQPLTANHTKNTAPYPRLKLNMLQPIRAFQDAHVPESVNKHMC